MIGTGVGDDSISAAVVSRGMLTGAQSAELKNGLGGHCPLLSVREVVQAPHAFVRSIYRSMTSFLPSRMDLVVGPDPLPYPS
jgi:hypothetical protein